MNSIGNRGGNFRYLKDLLVCRNPNFEKLTVSNFLKSNVLLLQGMTGPFFWRKNGLP